MDTFLHILRNLFERPPMKNSIYSTIRYLHITKAHYTCKNTIAIGYL